MGKHLDLDKVEQQEIADMLMSIAATLFRKMDEGVNEPEIVGTWEVKDVNRIVEFSFKAKPIS